MVRRLIVGGLLLLLGAGVAVAALPHVPGETLGPVGDVARLPERLWARLFPPALPPEIRLADLTEPERQIVRRLAARLDGLVVWSSNRGGNHDLYLLDVRQQSVRPLTRHPHVDFLARFAPDGRRIVFLRSQRPWVSFREEGAWDVYLIDTDGTKERLLARGGYHPTWAPDGQAVLFLRGARVVRLDLVSGRETIVLDGQATEGIRGDLETPSLSRDGRRLAVTVRSREYNGVAVVDLVSRAITRLSPGAACQLTWGPRERLVWVEPGGRGGTQIMAASAPGHDRVVLMDLPGRYSHEYFPTLSNDGRWLVWGAAAKGHEHDRADYETFLWEVGSPWEEAVRLTHHAGNDQWPDVWVRTAS